MKPMQVPTMHTPSRVDYERMARNIVMKQRMRPPKAPRKNLVRRASKDWYLENDPQLDFNVAHYPEEEQAMVRSTMQTIGTMIGSMERRIRFLRESFDGKRATASHNKLRDEARAIWDQAV
ncbi:MAG: hypothetical protein HUU29_11615, partial [Planctomycetaceae bacterium]|nr:hypothetical protein [Planctomycetaceae bacterium]